MILNVHNLNEYLFELFKDIKCENETRAYIVSIFSNKNFNININENEILIYARIKSSYKFYEYQNLADWIFFKNVIFDNNLEISHHIAKMCYRTCFKLINKKWKVYENLADDLHNLEYQTKNVIFK